MPPSRIRVVVVVVVVGSQPATVDWPLKLHRPAYLVLFADTKDTRAHAHTVAVYIYILDTANEMPSYLHHHFHTANIASDFRVSGQKNQDTATTSCMRQELGECGGGA